MAALWIFNFYISVCRHALSIDVGSNQFLDSETTLYIDFDSDDLLQQRLEGQAV
jgi:hypothetical protein